jgi:protein required for attachment to host cells
MATTWIIAADASRARILQIMDRGQHLAEGEDLYNPAGRLNEREMTSDAEPRFRGTAGPGSDREATGAIEHEVEAFAKRIGDYLEKARTSHRYDRLHLIAPPKFLGQLRKELGKEVENLVDQELPKDLSSLNARDLEEKLFRSHS